MTLVRILVTSLLLAPAAACLAADWEMLPTGRATIRVSYLQTKVLEAGYRFWGADWDYAGTRLRLETTPEGEKTFSGGVEELGLEIEGTITSPAPNQLRYTWHITATRPLEGIIGGGLEFRLDPDSPSFAPRPDPPVLLPDERGFRWPVSPEQSLTVEFDEPVARVYFERGQTDTMRAMFLGEDVPPGERTIVMTVTLPEGGVVRKTLAERYGPTETDRWWPGVMAHDASPVDLSFLNHKPAGSRGFVRADGDRLVFEDGTEARFWGGNIAAYAIFADKENIATQARRIAALGYNLMRIHHHDSMAWVRRTVIDQSRPDSRHLDEEVMDRLDWWIKCLKDEGVYVWLDLHVGRLVKDGDEIGPGLAEMLRRSRRPEDGASIKGFCYFNERIERLMREFNETYLTHVNRYTGTAYKDEPAIMGLLITNENDLTNHFGNLMLPDKNNPWHHEVFDRAVRAFADRHELEYEQTWRTWEHGPSKLFLADWEHAWNVRMLEHLESLGVRVPVATTQMWGGMPFSGLPPLTAGGIIDVHSYGGAEALSTNPRYADNYVSYLLAGQAWGKPVAVTEWNVPYPAVDRFTAPLYVASVSSLQGLDAPMIYNYSQRTFDRPTHPRTWSTFPDPALSGVMPAAALLYRRGDVQPARRSFVLKLDREHTYDRHTHPSNAATVRTLAEQSRIAILPADVEELDWDDRPEPEMFLPDDVEVVTDPDRDFIEPGRAAVRSDTGELTRDWRAGFQLIDTPRTQAAHGWIGGRDVALGDVTLDIETPKAAVAVSSLDGEPIGSSRRVLITAVARVVASEGGRMPLLSEPIRGDVRIRGPENLKLVALAADGSASGLIQPPYADGVYTISLPVVSPGEGGTEQVARTHWFLLTDDKADF